METPGYECSKEIKDFTGNTEILRHARIKSSPSLLPNQESLSSIYSSPRKKFLLALLCTTGYHNKVGRIYNKDPVILY
tara:strand:+ start:315 stop:548 length:234 start_codon:yes stop_codon:yes gene_type:complete